MLNQLSAQNQTLITLVQNHEKHLNTLLAVIQKNLSVSLARRQGLPGLNLFSWSLLGHKFLQLPGLVAENVHGLVSQVKEAIIGLSYWQFLVLIAYAGFWFVIWLWGRAYLRKQVDNLEAARERFAKP